MAADAAGPEVVRWLEPGPSSCDGTTPAVETAMDMRWQCSWLAVVAALAWLGCVAEIGEPAQPGDTPYEATVPTERLHAVWYATVRQSFLGELAEDSGSPSPRSAAIDNIDQHFGWIRDGLGANAVVIRLSDDDSFAAQYGGGLSHAPSTRPRPRAAVAQAILLALADKHGLRVVFVVEMSSFHLLADDTAGTDGTTGMWGFIHAAIDPTPYYGVECAAIDRAGLSTVCTRSFYDDPRVAGWIFQGELKPAQEVPRHAEMIARYWNHFFDLVHWNGSRTGFAGIYVQASTDAVEGPDAACTRIVNFKQMFAPGNAAGNRMPDLFGFEWYGGGGYDLTQVWGGIHQLTDCFLTDNTFHPSGPTFPLPGRRVFLAEGGSDQIDNPARPQFYTDAISAAHNKDLAGIFVWHTDAYANQIAVDPEPPHGLIPASSADAGWLPRLSLFQHRIVPRGRATLPGNAWHGASPSLCADPLDPACYATVDTAWPIQLDQFEYTGLNEIGIRVSQAFAP